MSAWTQQPQDPLAERGRFINIFGAANRKIGSYDDFPVLNPGIDPMVYLLPQQSATTVLALVG